MVAIWNAVRAAPVHRPLKEFPFDTGEACLGYFARCLVDHSGAAWHVRMDLGVDTDHACLFVAQRLRGVRLAAAARSAEVDPIVAKMLWNGLRCVWGIEDLNGILVPLGAAINTRSAGPFESSIDLGRRVAATLLAPGVVDAKTCRVFEHVVAGSTNAQLREMFNVSDAQLGRRIAAGLKAAQLARRWQVLPALAARIDGEPW